ncbi:MAG: DUF72 domain-containing protein, partial [Sutterella wadsworthensis]
MKGLDGLSVLARTPWLGCVCLERGYLHPHSQAELAVLASAVPADFRFIVRAPALVTSVFVHDRRGRAGGLNREFLNVAAAAAFVRSCTDGLGEKLGGVLFDFGPYPSSQMKTLQGRQKAVEELGAFAEGLVRELGSADAAPVLAFEVRNPTLLTPRLMALLRNFGIRPVMGLNEGMPGLQRQMRALAACDAQDPSDPDWRLSGPLFVRWHRSGPLSPVFVRDPESKSAGDPVTRTLIASLVMRAVRSGVPAYVLAGDDAEGDAPRTLLDILASLDGMRAAGLRR